MSALLTPLYAGASSGEDRCYIKECLCQVRLKKKSSKNTKSILETKSISIFFEENKYSLNPHQEKQLTDFLSLFAKKGHKASIIGYTDGCGSKEHNKKLSRDRARQVYLRAKSFLKSYSVGLISGGEISKEHTASARRVDVIIHSKNKLVTAIEKIPSDFYLIDASGSMWTSYDNWNHIMSASLKPNSKVFLSITNGCKNGMYMSNVRPRGGTEVWWSYWNIIDKMKPGESLLIISDFESQVPLSSREHRWFVRKIKDAGIIVRSIRP